MAKAVVAQAMVDERLPLSIDNAIKWVSDRFLFVDAILEGGDHHEVVTLPDGRFSIRARKGRDNLEHFQNVVSLVDAVRDEFVEEFERSIDHQTGEISAMILREL